MIACNCSGVTSLVQVSRGRGISKEGAGSSPRVSTSGKERCQRNSGGEKTKGGKVETTLPRSWYKMKKNAGELTERPAEGISPPPGKGGERS